MSGKTLYDKIWDRHFIGEVEDYALIYIDRHLIHEITSPQAMEGLEIAGRSPWRPDSVFAVPDHNISTRNRHLGVSSLTDPQSVIQVKTLEENCNKHNIFQLTLTDHRQGIVHVVGPEQGVSLPGMTLVCGDSHTGTHGALACMSLGIGTSEVEHVLATQCLKQKKFKNMKIEVNGDLAKGVTAKDLILYVIGKTGTAAGTGYAIEFCGSTIRNLSIEGRMTVCNMAIEAGARVGMVAFDEKTEAYVEGRPFAPKGEMWEKAIQSWRQLFSDEDAEFDKSYAFNAEDIKPQVSWGTSPAMTLSIDDSIPYADENYKGISATEIGKMLDYMGLRPGQSIKSIKLDKIFIGSCTNGRIEDLRLAASQLINKKIACNIKQAIVVPGSGLVKAQAEQEGLNKIFIDAGFEWRDPGCSMCVAINNDRLSPEERCASTSNRNFEGRQGLRGRTHLVSPAMAAAAAVAGHFVDFTQ
ncbi:MAG: 3-isopropylmalate dehydratase large subunit [Gammaproteobacteria bacterium]|nr:3-isopropylmalate dehydratase large subunit [Gammaproteobacteria bacterium]MDH5629112.1 3-isopropylmalate dehydratase large subunit [Gammaproteobacteria bacterium]